MRKSRFTREQIIAVLRDLDQEIMRAFESRMRRGDTGGYPCRDSRDQNSLCLACVAAAALQPQNVMRRSRVEFQSRFAAIARRHHTCPPRRTHHAHRRHRSGFRTQDL